MAAMIGTLNELADAWWDAEDAAARDRLAQLLRESPELRKQMRQGALSAAQLKDERTFRRMLALCDLQYRGDDLRDCIVTLVLLRHAASQHGIDPLPLLRDASRLASPELRSCFESALRHTRDEVLHTVRAFGQQ